MKRGIKYTTVIHHVLFENNLTVSEYMLLERIRYFQSKGEWCFEKRESQATFLQIERRSTIRIVSKLVEKGLLERGHAQALKCTEKWFDLLEADPEVNNQAREEEGKENDESENNNELPQSTFVREFKAFIEPTGHIWSENDVRECHSLYSYLKKLQYQKTRVNQKLDPIEAISIVKNIYNRMDDFNKNNFTAAYLQRHFGRLSKLSSKKLSQKEKIDLDRKIRHEALRQKGLIN